MVTEKPGTLEDLRRDFQNEESGISTELIVLITAGIVLGMVGLVGTILYLFLEWHLVQRTYVTTEHIQMDHKDRSNEETPLQDEHGEDHGR